MTLGEFRGFGEFRVFRELRTLSCKPRRPKDLAPQKLPVSTLCSAKLLQPGFVKESGPFYRGIVVARVFAGNQKSKGTIQGILGNPKS